MFYTPIGAVPETYHKLPKLMERACISVRTEKGQKVWSITADKDLVPSTRTSEAGRVNKNKRDMHPASNEHHKFCAIKALLMHRLEKKIRSVGIVDWQPGIDDLLDLAIGETLQCIFPDMTEFTFDAEGLFKKNWRDVQNICADEGVYGYQHKAISEEKTQEMKAEALPFGD